MKILKTLVLATLLVSTSSMANLIDVSKIRITSTALNSDNYYIQLTELLAYDVSGNDVALSSVGATAIASPQWDTAQDMGVDNVIDGVLSQQTLSDYYHSAAGDFSAFVEVTLFGPTTLSAIELVGRDDCCEYRDVYNVEFFDTDGSSLFSAQGLDAENATRSVRLDLSGISNAVEASAPSMVAVLFPLLLISAFRRKG